MLRPVPGAREPGAAEQGATCPLGACDGSGWLLDEETNTARPCGCREQRIRRAAAGNVGIGIGRRFLEVSFDRDPIASLDPRVLRHVRAFAGSIEEQLDAGRGLWFDGPVGTGKTSLAILVAKAAHDAGRTCAFFPVPRLLAEIKRTYERDASESYLQLFQRLCSVDLLVLDDLGAQRQTDWVLEQLYSIVNDRWSDRRSIVVTTNVPEPDPEAPLQLLRTQARELREEVRELRSAGEAGGASRAEDAVARAEEVAERVERSVSRLERLEQASEADPLPRLRQQVGARTVSRLVEICDDPVPIMGGDLRLTAQGA